MHDTMNPSLPDWLDPHPIAAHVLKQCPSAEFERGLQKWKELRSGELDGDGLPDWGYFHSVFEERLEHTGRDFQTAELAREELRKGGESDLWLRSASTPPTHHLEVTALDLGWRLVPLACWAGKILGRPDIPRDVEAACRAWTLRADAVWLQLKRMPARKRNTDSHKVAVAPLINDARMLRIRVQEELCQYGELVDYLRPYCTPRT